MVKLTVRDPAPRSVASFEASLCTTTTFLNALRVGAKAIAKFSRCSGPF